MRKTCWSEVIFLGLMNASSTIFQNSEVVRVSIIMSGVSILRILRPSMPILRWRRETAFRSASSHGLSAHNISISMSLWHLFCQFNFCCEVRALRSRSDFSEDPMIVMSYIGSGGSSTILSFAPRNIYRRMFSLASKASLLNPSLFPSVRWIQCRLVPKASIPSGVLVLAGCAMS